MNDCFNVCVVVMILLWKMHVTMVFMVLMGRCAHEQKALSLAAWMCMSERLFVRIERSSAYAVLLLRWFT